MNLSTQSHMYLPFIVGQFTGKCFFCVSNYCCFLYYQMHNFDHWLIDSTNILSLLFLFYFFCYNYQVIEVQDSSPKVTSLVYFSPQIEFQSIFFWSFICILFFARACLFAIIISALVDNETCHQVCLKNCLWDISKLDMRICFTRTS